MKHGASILRFASLLGGAWIFAACASQEPPTPPSPAKKPTVSTPSSASTLDAANKAPVNPTPVKNPSDTEGGKTSFYTGGAPIGSAEVHAALTACHGSKSFYDRFNGAGACTGLSLAKVDCSIDGIKAILSESQKQQFDEALIGPYSGWAIDQCLDCPPNSGAYLCKRDTGETQEGTKVFFVREESGEIQSKTIVIPKRPGV